MRFATRLMLRIGCIPVKLTGIENLLADKTVIYAVNHASYLDAVVLLAILPTDFSFIGKKELLNERFIGTVMKKLNYIAIDRSDLENNLGSVTAIEKALRNKQSILIFPEGTFTYAAGLRPFKLGAFSLAVATDTPIIPISLAGTRNILRSDERLFSPGRIKVHISKAITPQSKEWSEVIRLRDMTRAEIAKHCEEPTLDLIKAGLD